jgi:hypothetical protein
MDKSEDFYSIIEKRSMYNGQPFSYWQSQADELAVELIVRSAESTDSRSLIGHLARKRLLEIAQAENPTVYEKVLASRDACMRGFVKILGEVLK